MSSRTRTANLAGLLIFSCTAFVTSGVSMADESIPTPAANMAVVTSSPALNAGADIRNSRTVAFAPPREVVQPLDRAPSLSGEQPTGSADQAESASSYSSLASLVANTDTVTPVNDETDCLASAVFYESRSESLEGQLAVARVILNRSEQTRFGADICSVVTQPGQFSFVQGGKIPEPGTYRPAWKTAVAIARIAMKNAWESKAEGALYFHARRVAPGWRRSRVAVIDNHIFYR